MSAVQLGGTPTRPDTPRFTNTTVGPSIASAPTQGGQVQFGYDSYGRLQALINENGER